MKYLVTPENAEEDIAKEKRRLLHFIKAYVLVEAGIFVALALVFIMFGLWQLSLVVIAIMFGLMSAHAKFVYYSLRTIKTLKHLRRSLVATRDIVNKINSHPDR